MKRVFILFAVLMFIVPSALAIEFYGIPWGISINKAAEELNSRGFSVRNSNIYEDSDMSLWKNVFYREYNESVYSGGYKINCYYPEDSMPYIAGYPVSWVDLLAHYDVQNGMLNREIEKSHYYQADLTFEVSNEMVITVFDDLSKKLTLLYGDAQENEYAVSNPVTKGYVYKMWEAEDHTAVCLYRYELRRSKYKRLHLAYGKTDCDSILLEIGDLLNQEKLKLEEERVDNSSDNITGL